MYSLISILNTADSKLKLYKNEINRKYVYIIYIYI